MNPPNELNPSVNVDALGAKYVILDSESIYIKRDFEVFEEGNKKDVFGSGWVFMSGELEAGKAAVRLANGELFHPR